MDKKSDWVLSQLKQKEIMQKKTREKPIQRRESQKNKPTQVG